MSQTNYFPSLDRCLAGPDRLISWKVAYTAVLDVHVAEENTALRRFFDDEETLAILCKPLAPWTTPTQGPDSTRSNFETKIAPIHVSQSANGDYDLEEIKRDALWLSEQLRIDELVALRVAILEWQQRAADRLTGRVGEADTAVAPTSDLRASLLASTPSFNASINGSATATADFSKEEVRHDRLLRIYLEEWNYVLKLSADVVSYFAAHNATGIRESREWIDRLAVRVSDAQCSIRDSSKSEEYLCQCIEWVDKSLEKLGAPDQWLQSFRANGSREDMFATFTLESLSNVIRLVLAQLSGVNSPPSATVVMKWFYVMRREQYKHLQELAGTSMLRDVSYIQCLGSAVSLTLLQCRQSMLQVADMAEAAALPGGGVRYPRLEAGSYVTDDECVEELNRLIFQAAMEGYEPATPAIYAWALIIRNIRDHATRLGLARRETEVGDDGADYDESHRGVRSQESQLEKLWELIQGSCGLSGEARGDPARALLEATVEGVYGAIPAVSSTLCTVYPGNALDQTSRSIRGVLLELIQDGFEVVPYSEEVLEAMFAVFAPSAQNGSSGDSLLDGFVLAGYSQPYVLDQALQRFPYELSPFLRLLTLAANTDSVNTVGPPISVHLLENMQTVTLMVSHDFRAFRLENEEANTNEILLTDPLPLFVPKRASSEGEQRLLMDRAMSGIQDAGGSVIALPAATTGHIVREDRPMVFKLQHPHSGLEYFGLLLSTLLPTSPLMLAAPKTELDRPTASEIVILLNALLSAAQKQQQGVEEARFVLGRLSFALPNATDIITTLADIWELELLSHIDQAAQEGSLDLVIACADFFTALVAVSPERVWSVLGRSSLLGLTGGASALAAVVGGAEIPPGRFRFLIACMKLYGSLVEDAVAGLVKRRRAKATRTGNRFDSPIRGSDATPERTVTTVLGAFQRVALDAFQNLGSWRFQDGGEKQAVAVSMLEACMALLHATHGLQAPVKPLELVVGDGMTVTPRERLAKTLEPAGEMVLAAFAPETGVSTMLDSVASLFTDGLPVADNLLPVSQRLALLRQVNTTCDFLALALRSAAIASAERAAKLAVALVKGVPVLATLFAADQAYKQGVTTLLCEMVEALARSESDPPSLLGHLGTEAAKAFLTLISQLDRPLRDLAMEVKIWHFFTTVLKGRQQWFAIYLLTGAAPSARRKDLTPGGQVTKGKSMLAYALDELADLSTVSPKRAKAILRFLAVAQNIWAWATVAVRSHAAFLPHALAWLDGQQPPPRAANNAEALISADEHMMAASLCDILAVNLHASLETGDLTLLNLLVPRLGFLKTHGVAGGAYNRSLHRNLAENLAKKFPGCELADFTRTPAAHALSEESLESCYDTEFAGRVLGHQALAWFGDESLRTQGFASEVARANVNLRLVEAQGAVLQAWKNLAATLAECVGQDVSGLRPALVTATEACLRANAEANVDVPGTAAALQTRAELAFVLLSKLVGAKATDPAMRDLLPVAWELVRTSPVDYDIATAEQDLLYYRTLLQLLFLAVRPHCYMPLTSPSAGSTVNNTDTRASRPVLSAATADSLVEILRKTIAPGFRALCANLHTDLQLAQPGDFALLTALLQALLSAQGAHVVHSQLAEVVASTNLVRSALSLYSWADQLAEVMDQDPIYGETAITFLLSLSGVRAIAEHIALNGALVQISSANLSNYFRKPGGKGPFDEPRRMFAIWTEGFLPLCLNLLDAVGPPLAGEVAGFLNSFPEQLGRAETALRTEGPGSRQRNARKPHAGAVTLGVLREVRALVTIGLVLQSDVARAAAEGVDAADIPALSYDLQEARAEMEKLQRMGRGLAGVVVATNEREAGWAGTGAPGGQAGGGDESVLVGKCAEEIRQVLGCCRE